MKNHDVFVLPSVGETFGMVYLEAMSQGCITVCTKDDGIDGIIKDGENGFLTLPNSQDIKNTLDRINSLSQNERKVLIHNGFDTIKTLTPEICANNYLQQIIKFL
jgi:glycosyltransferase involved in cell wall biosynthesis